MTSDMGFSANVTDLLGDLKGCVLLSSMGNSSSRRYPWKGCRVDNRQLPRCRRNGVSFGRAKDKSMSSSNREQNVMTIL
jgi:hypothetical protein